VGAVVLSAAAFAVALTAVADSQSYGRELSQRLVPAAAAANNLLSLYTAQQTSLRDAVTDGNMSGLGPYFNEGTALLQAQRQVGLLASGDRPMTARLNDTTAAYQRWLADVVSPQIAAMRRGDFAAARALQADIPKVSPLTLAVRSAGLRLQSQITSEQQTVTGSLNRAYNVLLGALIAMIVVVTTIAALVINGVWRGMLLPFGHLNKAVAAVADGRYHRAIPAVGPPELAALSRGVELMRTRLVAALNERERAQESLRNLFDLAPDAMIAAARDGSIMMANARAIQVFGYPIGELVGHSAEMLVPEEWRERMAMRRTSYFTDPRGRPAGREIKAFGRRRDGSTFPTEIRLSWLPTEQGTVLVSAIRDVSERLAMEAERERLRDAAETERFQRRQRQSLRLESLGQLIGGVAHDFNSLLNVIAGYADFTEERLRELAVEDERLELVRADVEQVQTAAQQAIRVTRQLLTFSKGEPTKREVLDLNEVVEKAGQLLRRSLGEQIELIISTEPRLWRVEADRGQLDQVLVNLALNARDAMPGGGRLSIGTSNAEVDAAYAAQRPNLEPGRYCQLAVSDTGTGMDEATIERVFEPFFSTKPRGRGTGLGLATVYGIVSGLGGSIDIYSEKGLGTTINVLLPFTEHAAVITEPDRPDEDLRGHGELILLVEDEQSLRTMASRLLARNGYQVCEAGGGTDALCRAEDPAQRIDILVADMVMPGMLGNEVVARVRAIRPDLPALFISGYAEQVLDFHGIPAPSHDILQKPFTEAALLRRVRRALDRAVVPRQTGYPDTGTPHPFGIKKELSRTDAASSPRQRLPTYRLRGASRLRGRCRLRGGSRHGGQSGAGGWPPGQRRRHSLSRRGAGRQCP
jgi:PAS domain S-box-containing protein